MYAFCNPANDLVFRIEKGTILIRISYLPTDAQENCSKRILKFTLKQLRVLV
jgi:hypothetical protein